MRVRENYCIWWKSELHLWLWQGCLSDLHIAESLSVELDITSYAIKRGDKWLFVACDGVFDMISKDFIADIGERIGNSGLMAYTIRNTAFGSFSMDNITSIGVNLHLRKVDPAINSP